eukprot:9337936-Heterocapsa_arctica.AAC.2
MELMSLRLVTNAQGVTMTISPWAIHLKSAGCPWCFLRDDNNQYGTEVMCRTCGQHRMVFAQDRLMPCDLERDRHLRGTTILPRRYSSPVSEITPEARLLPQHAALIVTPIQDDDPLQYGSDLPASEELKFQQVKEEVVKDEALSPESPPAAPDPSD